MREGASTRRPLRRGARTLAALVVALGAVLPAVWASPFGINAHIPGPTVLDEIEAAGITWVRMDFRWDLLEPSRGRYDWSLYDPVVDAARARGLRIYATLQATPGWATQGAAGAGVPADFGDWADFCYVVAKHFRGRVAAWGMWNEPNLPGFWAGTRDEYIAGILIEGGRAIHAADSTALVAGPDLAHLSSHDWEGWLEDTIRRGSAVLDVVTHHVYPSGSSHTDVTKKLESGGSQPWEDDAVREVLDRVGWLGRPFWLTETGMESGTAGDADQAGFYTNLLADWFRPDRDLSWIDRIFFYEMVDDPAAPHPTYGILGAAPELHRKQAWYAYREFIAGSQVDDGEIIADTLPRYVAPGESVAATVTVRNTGTTTWDAAEGIVLSTFWYGGSLVQGGGDLPDGAVVPPGDTVDFSVVLRAPTLAPWSPPVRRLDLRLKRSGRWWFGTPGSWNVTVGQTPPPVVEAAPVPQQVLRGRAAVFTVEAAGTEPLTYCWQRNGRDIHDSPSFAGAGTSVLLVLGVDEQLVGDYRCVISNGGGEAESAPAPLSLVTVTPRQPAEGPPVQPGARVEGPSGGLSRGSVGGGRGAAGTPRHP